MRKSPMTYITLNQARLQKIQKENAWLFFFFEALRKKRRKRNPDHRVFAKTGKKQSVELKRKFSVLIAQYEKELLAAYKNELLKKHE